MRKLLLSIVVFVFVTIALWGCGSSSDTTSLGNSTSLGAISTNPISRDATLTFTVTWPKTRVIPTNTNRLILYLGGPGMETRAYILDKNQAGSTITQTISNIPAGPRRIFSAEARQVDPSLLNGNGTLRLVSATSSELQIGTRLAAGNDGAAHDLHAGDSVRASVELQPAATPSSGITGVNATVNQVIGDAFPSLLLLQMLRDQNGNPITNINTGNLEIIEDGKPATITDIRTVRQGSQELSAVLVLDRSGSMSGTPNLELEKAASAFVDRLAPIDFGEIINFASSYSVSVPFTTDKIKLKAGIAGRQADGGTALYDALYQGIGDAASRKGRIAVIAMTDGENTSGKIGNVSEVIQLAKKGNIPLFMIGLGNDNRSIMEQLASETGGLYLYAPNPTDLDGVYNRVSNQLDGQIQVSFISPDPVKQNRQRSVTIRLRYGSFNKEFSTKYIL